MSGNCGGTIDPTLLQNDSYVLRLEVYDSIGAVTFVEQIVNISGELKLGNFRLSFTDMAIPVSGIPITISRTYDTLQAGRSSELGFGWRMEFRNIDLRTCIPKTGFEQYGIYSSFVPGTRVYITLPGGKREGFTFTPQIRSLFDLTIATGFSCYFSLDYWDSVLREVKRVLKPEGLFVFDVLNPDLPLSENWAILETYLGAEVFLESLTDWEKTIQAAGGKIVAQKPGELFQLYKVKF